MHKPDHHINPEYRQRILRVLHYINLNLAGDVSLETLAGIASYSPFHFQKIFSAAISESPKQYVMRLRLERAAHHLKVFQNLPVVEIAMGCGFSSPSIFARAFRNYYGFSAEEFREMPLEKGSPNTLQFKTNKTGPALEVSDHWNYGIVKQMEKLPDIHIVPSPTINTFPSLQIACYQTTLSHPENISFAFKSLLQWAIPHDMVAPDTRYIGIWLDVPFYTSPDKCRYIAGIELKNEIKTHKGIDLLTMNEGKYANFSMSGNLESTLDKLMALNHKYLAEMGYEIAEIICYEIFDECPSSMPYNEINRRLLVPVKPAK